ncbi:hypothetical protein, no similarity [Maudiozyma barnettii]|nr:hypothetical protein, no similarity [Kazachstania barnettii]
MMIVSFVGILLIFLFHVAVDGSKVVDEREMGCERRDSFLSVSTSYFVCNFAFFFFFYFFFSFFFFLLSECSFRVFSFMRVLKFTFVSLKCDRNRHFSTFLKLTPAGFSVWPERAAISASVFGSFYTAAEAGERKGVLLTQLHSLLVMSAGVT